ncbi:hypothetical protein K505DRAFT_356587 [Melanomma pulvis-pyrius CBS 109.77]|uniref:Uncharacterized protein n=1 Tax=Melanomma pulvis-pyrius CBS 109.77 TaxID=1314802 RepID=A0A6A6XV46_9PLEO|nr:hypothetical protein K505DRAFT_356587 [Melanomma pulvis-pyrius CBS 109.77]
MSRPVPPASQQQGVTSSANKINGQGINLSQLRTRNAVPEWLRDLLRDEDSQSSYGRTYCHAIGARQNPDQDTPLNTLLEYVVAATTELRDSSHDPQRLTLQHIAKVVGEKILGQSNGQPLNQQQLDASYQALFASIGWLSFLYEPSNTVTNNLFSIEAPAILNAIQT